MKINSLKNDGSSKIVTQLFAESKKSDAAFKSDIGITNYGDFKSRKKRISKYGLNDLQHKKFPWFQIFLEEFCQPFNILLFSLIILDVMTYIFYEKTYDHLVSAGVSIIILLITYIIAFIQKYKSYKIEKKINTVALSRFFILKKEITESEGILFEELQKSFEEITYEKITVGDTIMLKPGDIVPADCRIIWSNNFAVDDNYIRGKLKRVRKTKEYKPATFLYNLENIVVSHSIVTDGYAIAVTIAISKNKVSRNYIRTHANSSHAFSYRGLKKITLWILLSALVVFPVALLSTYYSSNDKGIDMWFRSILYSITIVVSLIPEALPALVAFNLQHGSAKIKNKNVIVKNFQAIHDLGAIDIFISNKSGPITRDKPILANWINFDKEKDDKVFNYAYINAYFQNSLPFSFEQTILDFVDDNKEILNGYNVVKTVWINHQRKSGSVIVEKDGVMKQITVSPYNQIIDDLKYYRKDNQNNFLNEEDKFNILHTINSYTIKGYHAFVVATKIILSDDIVDTNELMYEGIILFKDLIRDNVDEALLMFKKYGIDFKLLSGDTSESLRWTANEIGINNPNIITGPEASSVTQKELQVLIKSINVFADLSPIQKATVIHNYIKNRNVVAYMGDGMNDIYAIKKADVGIVPKTATPIAKEFADIIVENKDLNNFDNAIKWGRITFLNSIKFIKLSITTNLGLFIALLISGIWFPFLPLTSSQLLLQNLVIDIANIAFIMDRVSDEGISKPIKWNMKSIISFSFITSLAPALMSLLNLVIICYGLKWFDPSLTNEDIVAQKIQTTFFIESFISRIVSIFVYRTEFFSLKKHFPKWKFTTIMLSMLFFLIILMYIPKINDLFQLVAPDPIWWTILLCNVIVLFLLEELVKYIYIKKCKYWF